MEESANNSLHNEGVLVGLYGIYKNDPELFGIG